PLYPEAGAGFWVCPRAGAVCPRAGAAPRCADVATVNPTMRKTTAAPRAVMDGLFMMIRLRTKRTCRSARVYLTGTACAILGRHVQSKPAESRITTTLSGFFHEESHRRFPRSFHCHTDSKPEPGSCAGDGRAGTTDAHGGRTGSTARPGGALSRSAAWP